MLQPLLVSVLALALVGCGPETVCPAIGWSNSLTVRLADDWAAGEPRSVTVRCPEGGECGAVSAAVTTLLPQPEREMVSPPGTSPLPTSTSVPAPETQATTQVLTDGSATFSLDVAEALVVTVSEAGSVLTELTVHPEWVRVGGSEECGGPHEAAVVVPAP
jgi:hypothetical protein